MVTGFYELAKATVRTLMDRELAIVGYPGMILHDSPETVVRKVNDHLVGPIITILESRLRGD
ncbi:MAG: hypothetical protein GEV28_37585 [Actinophytocola sp.]|uniref:hypothetical protein n=1 Tax=Actinophytocola sp. TaxID=1872138 RepID=UPI0013222A61|nr:hypothetical protein [Actinophytocola sp.]MPZ85788.1 hypothetical protein [Actinophytocola sp.]